MCAQRLTFEVDPHLLSEIESGNCVIFAGSGISTETKFAHCNTLYDEVAHELGVSAEISFSDLMSIFDSRPNGRQKMVKMILDRFRYINSWRPLRNAATEFHDELSTMPYFSKIVTTNWDRYFEEQCAATPFVYDSDIAFWELSPRSVLKIHGSIDNLSSLIATNDDYAACERRLREGPMGAVLKQIFATKTCIFIGYSVRDSDFVQILPPPYFHPGIGEMSPDEYEEKVRQFPDVHKGALAQGRAIVGRMASTDDLVIQHTPFG